MNEVSGNISTTQNIKGSVSSTKGLAGNVSISGVAGIVGPAPDIQIGTTTTLEAGESAYVELDESSTQLTPIFNFGIPRGESGEAGKDGKDGLDGKDGQNGKDGYTPIKGVDYFTEEDIVSLNIVSKEYVDSAIATAIGGIENGSY